ncbi:MAG: sigma-54-dependent Fis family transcriptional regulator, partial [Flavobacteriaceae bacterium]|nr:sigma-54-dependent Fis family transcriptional regulator [Flavobacteriaceae bacterium]
MNYSWKGNIRQLRNITEQLSVIEQERNITADTLKRYLPDYSVGFPALIDHPVSGSDFANEREILYKVLFDMRNDINDLKKLTHELIEHDHTNVQAKENAQHLIQKIYGSDEVEIISPQKKEVYHQPKQDDFDEGFQDAETIDEPLSLQEKEYEMIKKALERNNNKRKLAAKELGISERTLYRKIKQFDL